jgi:peptidoglycan hydrolase CwlO-like protein
VSAEIEKMKKKIEELEGKIKGVEKKRIDELEVRLKNLEEKLKKH